MTSPTIVSNETVLLKNNISAFKVNISDMEQQKKGAIMVITKSPETYFVGYAATPDKLNKYLPIFQKMIDSLEFN